MRRDEVGTLCVVLHSHLPWVLGHGAWPVGEEWLHQAWTRSWLPVTDVLRRMADEGRRDLLTLGVTPVLAAQLDHPIALREVRTWTAGWSLRAQEAAARREPALRALAAREFRAAAWTSAQLEGPWRAGGSPVLADLAGRGAVELLGGPLTHPFLPLLDDALAGLALDAGLQDAAWRSGRAPAGIWSPECGHRRGLQHAYARLGVRHAVYDEATVRASGHGVHAGLRLAGTTVRAVGRDLGVTDLVWSSRSGYPTAPVYRDFHDVDVASGLQLRAVTGTGSEKRWYEPALAEAQVQRDARSFVAAVRDRLLAVRAARGSPGLVVVAWDTELFGHWWHEGPAFLEAVLRLLPASGVRLATLGRALDDGLVDGEVDLADGSWGAGKDWSVWADGPARPLADEGFWVQRRVLDVLGADPDLSRGRRPDLDQLVRQALLALSSDWAFMVTRDQAADYARERAARHRDDVHRLAALVEAGEPTDAEVARQRAADDPFPWLDARPLARRWLRGWRP
ncbi:1,4-alpha-glucan branching protein domain-containing protein [Angustibacter speluncae]